MLFLCTSPCCLGPVPMPGLQHGKPSYVTHFTLMHSRPKRLGGNVRWRKGSVLMKDLGTEKAPARSMPDLLQAHRCLGHKSWEAY